MRPRLVLASQSPRRSQLLRDHGFEFTVSSVQISEILDENLNLPDRVCKVAEDKVQACLKMGKWAKEHTVLLLGADTVVVLGDQILGKPKDQNQNREFLERLSGRTHQVITGLCLLEVQSGRVVRDFEISDVLFRKLSTDEIEKYVASGSGLDKAGGYGIQDSANLVASHTGSIENIVGLPIAKLTEVLQKNGWI